jgi:hypothetical protein
MKSVENMNALCARRAALLAILGGISSGCTVLNGEGVKAPPFAVEIDSARSGVRVDQVVRVWTERLYSFSLLYCGNPEDESGMRWVKKQAGDGGMDRNGVQLDSGVAVPLTLKITSLDESTEQSLGYFKDSDVQFFSGGGGRGCYSKLIDEERLKPGFYRLELFVKGGDSTLSGVKTKFEFGWRSY